MQCQFCGFDNTEMGLRDGRCNQCGGVLQWQDSSGDVAPEVQAAVANLAARIAPLEGAKGGADSQDLQAVAAVLRQKNGAPADRKGDAAPGGATDHEVDAQHLTNQWRPGLDTESHPLRTIKGVSTSSVSDLPVFIHPRAIRRAGDPEFVPSEYELLDVIGEGGVGVVYSARQSSIDRNVAVKMIRSNQGDNQSTRDKFLAEAIVTGDLDHPNIVPVYDLGKDPNGALFYSMKRVVGTPWSAVLTRKPQAENLEILMKVADAIAFAHARGVVHRDIKPENVMLGEFGEVLVMDWGIALPLSSYRKSGGVLLSQGLGGTPAYMAPEMATGPLAKIGMTSDVYLLGAVLYEIVTGQPPHRGADVMSCVLAAAKNEVAPTDKSGELLDIALRALATKPEDRYANVLEFQKAVRSYQSHLESVTLCERATTQLDSARGSESYDDYSRAVFAFEEAVTLWEGNESARRGQSEARRAFAECALAKGDYDLGLSQTDPEDPTHGDVIARLRAALRERRARDGRFRFMRLVALVLAAVTLVGGVWFTVWIYLSREQIQQLADDNLRESTKARKAEKDAKTAEGVAQTAATAAKESEQIAIAARDDATEARQRAERDQDRAEEEQFFAEVGVVNERIEGNVFDVAREVLGSHGSSNKARLRHWEWGRLEYLVNGGRAGQDVVQSVPSDGTLGTLAVSGDDQFVVTAEDAGRVILWAAADGRLITEWQADHEVFAIAISRDGRLVVTAGEGDQQQRAVGALRVWKRQDDDTFALAAQLTAIRDRLESVALSPDGTQVVAGGSRGEAFVWTWNSPTARKSLEGHLEAVEGVAFSADGKRVATASDDKTVRIWDVATGQERQRFRGHRSPVYAVAFSHRGDRVASGDYDRRVLVWPRDESTSLAEQLSKEVAEQLRGNSAKKTSPEVDETLDAVSAPLPKGTWHCLGHAGSIKTVGFSRDDSHLVTGGQDNTVKIWRLPTKEAAAPADEPVCLTTLRGHGGWVRSATLLAGAKPGEFTVISGAMDHAWRRWNAARYREVATLIGADGPVKRAMYTPDGRAIVVTRDDGAVEIWRAATSQLAKTLSEGHEFLVSQAIVSPNGQDLLTVAGDNTLRIWDLQRGVEQRQRMLENVGRRGIAALSADGRFVLTGGPNKTATWWDLTTSQIVHRLNPHGLPIETAPAGPSVQPVSTTTRKTPDITALAVSHDRTLLFTGDDSGMCRLWDAASGQLRKPWKGHLWGVTGATFLPNTSRSRTDSVLLLTVSSDECLKLWDVTKNVDESVATLRHLDPIWAFAVSADGRQAVTSSKLREEGTNRKIPGLWLWDLKSGQTIAQLPIAQAVSTTATARDISVNTLTWMADDSDAILVSLTDQVTSRQELWLWRPSRKTCEPARLPASARGALWTALPVNGGRQLITAGGKGARLWDTAQGRELMSFKPQSIVNAVDVSRDGRWLAVAGGDGSNGVVKLWSLPDDLQRAEHLQTVMGAPRREFTAVAFAPGGAELVTGDKTGEIRRWGVADGKPVNAPAFPATGTPVNDLRFTPDGRLLVAAGDDAVVRLIDTSSGKVDELAGHVGPIRCAAISRDSRWLITGGDDRMAIIWDLVQYRRIGVLMGHSAVIESVAFSPDALRAVTGSRDTTAKVWNLFPVARLPDAAATPSEPLELKEVLTLPRHGREVTAVSFAPSGLDVLTASVDFSAKVWLGESLAPAVELAPGGIGYVAGSPPMMLDEQAVVSCPSPVDNERLSLSLTVQGAVAGDALVVVPRETPLGTLTVRDGQVWLRPVGADDTVAIAALESPAEGAGLTLNFAPQVPPSWVQAVLRSIAFHNDQPEAAASERRIRCQLTSSAHSTDDAPAEDRTVQVRSPAAAP